MPSSCMSLKEVYGGAASPSAQDLRRLTPPIGTGKRLPLLILLLLRHSQRIRTLTAGPWSIGPSGS